MTMTPDQCFDEMAVVLGLPKDTGYTDILAVVKKLKEDDKYQQGIISKYSEENDMWHRVKDELTEENEKLKEEIQELQEKITCLESDSYNEVSQAEFDDMKQELQEEIQELQDINGKNVRIPTEEELKVLGVSREEFIMLAKKSDCAY